MKRAGDAQEANAKRPKMEPPASSQSKFMLVPLSAVGAPGECPAGGAHASFTSTEFERATRQLAARRAWAPPPPGATVADCRVPTARAVGRAPRTALPC